MRKTFLLTTVAGLCLAVAAMAADAPFVVGLIEARDEKPVFATVETPTVLPARVRTGGTIASLSVREGDLVRQGQVIAVLTDRKLAEQIAALDAGIAGLKVQAAQAQAELDRNAPLFDNGVTSKTAMDQLRTQAALAASALKARQAERAALDEQIAQGRVLAPATGRILTVPVAVGTVMMGGETVATMTTDKRVIRLQVPESNAKTLAVGDMVRVEGGGAPIALIYPHVVQGMVQVDVSLPDDGAQSAGYFVGRRVEVWVPQAPRPAIAVPSEYVATRYGLDFAKLRTKDGKEMDVPVVLGQPVALADGAEGVEVLTGLQPGDELVRP